MTTPTSLQRDFLDRFYTEMANGEAGYATAPASEHEGLTYQHFRSMLWDRYLCNRGGATQKAVGWGISSALTSASATDLSLAIVGGLGDPT